MANGGELLTCYDESSLNPEEVGVLSFHEKAPWVVTEIVKPTLKLTFAKEKLVVVATTQGGKQTLRTELLLRERAHGRHGGSLS